MSALAHPGPIVQPSLRPRHLALVPSAPRRVPESDGAAPERLADVLELPTSAPVRRAQRERSQADAEPGAAALRLTRRGRVVLAGLAIVAAAAVGSVVGSLAGAEQPLSSEAEPVTVLAGQSLWTIASEVTEPGADVGETMSQIVVLNELESDALAVGQVLLVPTGD